MHCFRPRFFALLLIIAAGLGICAQSSGQSISDLDQLWHQTFTALKNGQRDRAEDSFGKFNRDLRVYLQTHSLDWKIEFLAGSLDCQFAQSRQTGAEILKSVLQTNRDLNDKGMDYLRSLVNACSAPNPARADATPDLPADIIDTSAHFQTPGVHSVGKGGFAEVRDPMSGNAVSPKSAAELLARRVQFSSPQKALDAALARLPGTSGGVVDEFVITSNHRDNSRALGVGRCLKSYQGPLHAEFEIERSDYIVTAYTAQSTNQVYEYARELHGLDLPYGVVAYSVVEDMSLSGIGDPDACGSLAHELVHLLIKRNFPLSPAWLEEGLASEVAVASVQPNFFKLSRSWRDDTLQRNWGQRPKVKDLLEMSWPEFNAAGTSDLRRSAAVQAMAAVFIRYLDAQGKLPAVYFAVRDQHLSADLSHSRSYRQIVEDTLGKNIDDVDQNFQTWFRGPEGSPPHTYDPQTDPCPNSPVQGPCPNVMNQAARPKK
jgi:hypothetical protein